MPMMRVSEPVAEKIKELQDIRQRALGRGVSAAEIMEILIANYEDKVKEESEAE